MRGCAIAMLLLALSACATRPAKAPVAEYTCTTTTPTAACAASIAALSANAAVIRSTPWSMTGRASIIHGDQGGSLRIEWSAHPSDGDTIILSVPVTRQSWRLQMAPGQSTLYGLPGGPRSGDSAEVLLRDATGWDIPVMAMHDWLRGVPATLAPDAYIFDQSNGRLTGLQERGWTIQYLAMDAEGRPLRINASRGIDKIRLVIDQWGNGSGE